MIFELRLWLILSWEGCVAGPGWCATSRLLVRLKRMAKTRLSHYNHTIICKCILSLFNVTLNVWLIFSINGILIAENDTFY